MNNRVCFCDLDRVVADPEQRFALATTAKLSALQDGMSEKEAVGVYWKTALNGEHVYLDELIDGVPTCLSMIAEQGYCIVYLTSRPEHMRSATEAWLTQHSLFLPSVLMVDMKPASKQFTKTVVWKVERFHELAENMQADETLLVDDEDAIRDALMEGVIASYSVKVCSSLVEACQLVTSMEQSSN